MKEKLDRVNSQLQAIASLNNTTFEYSVPDTNIIKLAEEFIMNIIDFVPAPHINPTPSGGIQFEWESGPLYLEVEIEENGSIVYFWCDKNAKIEDTGSIARIPDYTILYYIFRMRLYDLQLDAIDHS